MATTYTQYLAIERAMERARRDNDSYTVWRHRTNKNDFIVKNTAAADPRDFVRVYTVGPDGYEASYSHALDQ